MKIKQTAIRGSKWITVSTIFVAIATLSRISILTRFLSPSDFGLIAILLLVLNLLIVLSELGLNTAIIHIEKITRIQFSSLFWLSNFVSLFLYLIVFLVSPVIATFYNKPLLNEMLPILSIVIVVSSPGRIYKSIINKNFDFKQIALIEMFGSATALVVAIVLALTNFQIYSMIFSVVIQYFLLSVGYFLMGYKYFPISFHLNLKQIKKLVSIGKYETIGQMVNFINRDLDIIIIGKLLNAEILGGYSLIKDLVVKPSRVINPILVKVAGPILSKLNSNPRLLKIGFLKLTNINAAINIPAYFILMLIAPFVVKTLYGTNYIYMSDTLRVLSAFMMLRAIRSPIGALTVATGKTKIEFFWNIVVMITTPIAIIIGANYSHLGISIALLINGLILFIPSWRFLVYRMSKISLNEYIISIITINKFYSDALSKAPFIKNKY